MREYLFRGKTKLGGTWVFGDLIRKGKLVYIGHEFENWVDDYSVENSAGAPGRKSEMHYGQAEVIPETIGQYTGLCAIGKIKIFEGDIVKWGHIKGGEEDPIRIAEVKIDPDILFDSKNCNHVFRYGNFIYTSTDKYLSIIGNIHDNPELLTTTTNT